MADYEAYFNGEWMPYGQVRIDPLDRGFLTGDAVFDAARTFNGAGFRLREHVDRLYRSLVYARLEPGLTAEQMLAVTEEVIRRNEAARAEVGDYQVRQFVTRGRGRWAHTAGPPSVGVKVAPVDFGRFAHLYDSGAHAVIVRTQAAAVGSLDPKLKSYSRMHFNLAELEAAEVDPQGWPVLTDVDGDLAEGSSYNLFLVTDGVLRTPGARHILKGVSRAETIDLAQGLGITTTEERLQPYDLITADEAFFTSTSPCILPVTCVNQRRIGDGAPGPVTRRLIAAWSEAVGLDVVAQARTFA